MKSSKIEKGASAVAFSAKDIQGNLIKLSDYEGQKLYLVFFRKAACPFCNLGLQDLIRSHKEFQEKGIQIVALFASPLDEVLKYAGKQKPPFPIIPDGDYRIYESYGVRSSTAGLFKSMLKLKKLLRAIKEGLFSMRSTFQTPVLPADFLINEQQQVVKSRYGKTFDDHLSIPEILAWDTE